MTAAVVVYVLAAAGAGFLFGVEIGFHDGVEYEKKRAAARGRKP